MVYNNISITDWNVRGGSEDSVVGGDTIDIENYYYHELYNMYTGEYDAGLLRLIRRPNFNDFYIEVSKKIVKAA